MKRLIPTFLLGVLIVLAAWSHGTPYGSCTTSYFVSNTGSDAANGTSTGTPWQTITKVNTSTFTSGNCVRFNGGQTFTGTLMVGTGGATVSGAAIFGSYGTGRAIISSSAMDGIDVLDISSITIRDLILVGGGAGSANNGVAVNNDLAGNIQLTGLTLTNLDVSGYDYGVTVSGSNGTSGFTGAVLSAIVTHDNGQLGLTIGACAADGVYAHINALATNIIAYNNGKNGIFFDHVNTGTIQYSHAYSNGATASGGVGIWTFASTDVTIKYSESDHNLTTGTDGAGFDCDGATIRCIMEYNYAHDNFGAGFQTGTYGGSTNTGNVVRYNISQNDNYCLFVFEDGNSQSTQHYNNTCYISTTNHSNVRIDTAIAVGSVYAFRNNIFYCASSYRFVDNIPATGVTLQGNDYSGGTSCQYNEGGSTYSTFAAWQTATGQEKVSGSNVGLTSDPLLTNPGSGGLCAGRGSPSWPCPSGYTLQGGSPMLSVGLDLTGSPYNLSVGTQDYYGNAIPTGVGTGYNIGAY